MKPFGRESDYKIVAVDEAVVPLTGRVFNTGNGLRYSRALFREVWGLSVTPDIHFYDDGIVPYYKSNGQWYRIEHCYHKYIPTDKRLHTQALSHEVKAANTQTRESQYAELGVRSAINNIGTVDGYTVVQLVANGVHPEPRWFTLETVLPDEAKVMFRVWHSTGRVIALFPHIVTAPAPANCTVFDGAHAAGIYETIMKHTRSATLDEYEGLYNHLIRRYGYNLRIISRRGKS